MIGRVYWIMETETCLCLASDLFIKLRQTQAKERHHLTPLMKNTNPNLADLLRKHGGKTGAELEAAGK